MFDGEGMRKCFNVIFEPFQIIEISPKQSSARLVVE